MTLKEKLKEFDEKFIGGITTPTVHRIVQDQWFNKDIEINGNLLKEFISTAIQEALESLQGEERPEEEKNAFNLFENVGWNTREKKLREDINKFLNN